MLTGAMLKGVGAGDGHVLVVSQQRGGGLRQTCFRGRKLRFSRLAAMPDAASDGYESRVLAEIESTRRYLGSLQAGTAGEGLDVRVLSHGERLEGLRRALRRGDDGEARARYRLVDLATVARGLGMRRWNGGPAADALFVHLLARRRRPNHYATSHQTRRMAVLHSRHILRAASAGVVAGTCLFSAGVALEGVAANGHARSLALQTAHYERRYARARATLPPAPIEPAELERVVSVADMLHRRRTDPIDLLALVGDALGGFPRVRIESVSWRASDDPEAAAGTEHDDRGGPRPSGEQRRHDPGAMFQIARVGARIEPFDGDYRAAIDTIRRFAAALAAPPGIEHVRILTLPLELGSEHALTGAAGTTPESAEFEVRVTLRIPVSGPAEG